MFKKSKHYLLVVLAVMLIASLAFAGCTDKTNDTENSPTSAEATKEAAVDNDQENNEVTEKEPIVVSFIAFFSSGAEYPPKGNPVEKYIEEFTGVTLDIEAYSESEESDIMPARYASGDITDMVAPGWVQTKQSYFTQAIDAGLFWELSDLIPNYANLSEKINPISYENLKIDGKLYGVPKTRTLVRRNFYYRKDLAEQMDITEVPDTPDKLYALLKAYKESYPEMYPLVSDANVLPYLGFIMGAPNQWEPNADGFIKMEATQEYMEGLKFAKKLYDEELLYPEFSIITRPEYRGLFEEGKGAVMYDQLMYTNACEASLKANIPDSELWIMNFFKADDESPIRTLGETGHNGGLYITNKGDEQKRDQILYFLDKLCEPEMANLFIWGLEGVHYEVVDGNYTQIPDTYSDLEKNVISPYRYQFATAWPENTAFAGSSTDVVKERTRCEMESESSEYLVPLPHFTLFSQTDSEKGSELNTILSDARIQFVMGKIDEDGYWAEVEKWKTQGGDQISQEFAEAWVAAGN